MPTRALLPILTCVLVACSRQIQTVAPSTSTARPAQSQVAAAETTLFILDGSEIRRGDVNKIDPDQIATIRHLVGQAARAEYGPSAREIVEIVTTVSTDRSSLPAPLFLLDGREIPAELARVLNTKKIASVEVLKGVAARPYGERAQAGVVLVTSRPAPTRAR